MVTEKTVLDPVRTKSNNNETSSKSQSNSLNQQVNPSSSDDSNKSGVASAIAGAGLGILLGAVGSFATNHVMAADNLSDGDNVGDTDNGESYEWIDSDVEIADSVNDDMSFKEAFAAARAEVGAGGAFEWRGNLYGTYYANEWENMSAEEKEEYNNKFHWDERENDSTNSTDVTNDQQDGPTEDGGDSIGTEDNSDGEDNNVDESDSEEDLMDFNDNDSEDIEVDPEEDLMTFNDDDTEEIEINPEEDEWLIETEDEIEILGVDETNSSFLNSGDQEIHLLEIEGSDDMEYIITEDSELDYSQDIDDEFGETEVDYSQDIDDEWDLV